RAMRRSEHTPRYFTVLTFYFYVLQMIWRADAIFVHLVPLYGVLIAPLANVLRKPITLWYTHRNPSKELQRLLPSVRRVVTAVKTSFPLLTDKVRALGHGIDVDLYTPDFTIPVHSNLIVHVARLQPIKRQDALIRALPHIP